MKNPLIFGLTYASDIASGNVASAQNSDTYLSISDDGTVKKQSLQELSLGSDDYATEGTFTLNGLNNNQNGFNFINDEVTNQANGDFHIIGHGGGIMLFPYLSKIKTTTFVSLNGITVPASGYDISCFSGCPDTNNIGEIFAMQLNNNTYAVVQIVSKAGSLMTFRYKYNPGGSRTFN